ncbi:MAG: hypothetical protein IJW67_11535 [Blautia sp.]|nr:hypothetical protein [Blautia sp.]
MKKKTKHIAGIVVVLISTFLILACLTWLTERKDSYIKYANFFNQKEDFDVLFLGTSHVLNDIYPMELWKDYGIVSYNFGGHGNFLPTTYWVMKNALDYTTPKVMVIDGYFLSQETAIRDVYQNHISFDAFPLSMNKIRGTYDLMVKNEDSILMKTDEALQTSVLDFLWDFSVYHRRWATITAEDFKPKPTSDKGAEMRVGISNPLVFDQISPDKKTEGETLGIVYLRKIIEECQEKNIEVLLTYVPFPASEEEQMEANRMQEIADEYGVQYLNFLNLDVVDYNVDMVDIASHLNPSGARKVTDYLGTYFREHYDLPDRREDPEYERWYADYEMYREKKITFLKDQNNLKNVLMLLADDHFDTVVEVKDPAVLTDEKLVRVMKNAGIDPDQVAVVGQFSEKQEEEKPNANVRVIVYDHETQEKVLYKAYQYISD